MLGDRRVGDGVVAGVDVDGELEARLGAGVSNAGKHAARAGGSKCVNSAAMAAGVGREQPAEIAGERARPAELELRRAGDGDPAAGRAMVSRPLPRSPAPHGLFAGANARVDDVQPDAVERDGARRRVDAHVDVSWPAKLW